jgi:hypothetical protein
VRLGGSGWFERRRGERWSRLLGRFRWGYKVGWSGWRVRSRGSRRLGGGCGEYRRLSGRWKGGGLGQRGLRSVGYVRSMVHEVV